MNDNHSQIDALVRERLQALPPATPPPGGWAALQRELDGDADFVLRNALMGLASAAPAGWEALERKIDPRAGVDQQIAERLNGLEPMPPVGWDVLAARLYRENDEAVDAIVTDGLARTTPVVTSGWAALAARLELIGWRRSTLAAWKLTESCLLLSMLLLFVRFGPTIPSNPTFAELTKGFPIPLAATPVTATDVASAPATAVVAAMLPRAKETGGGTTATTTKDQTLTRKQQTIAGDARVPTTKTGAVRKMAETVTTTIVTETIPPVGKLPSVPATELTEEEIYLPEKIAQRDIKGVSNRLYQPSPALLLPRRNDSEPIHYYLNVFVSPVDLNQVITPATETDQTDIEADRRFTYGKSAGVLLDIAQGKNTLQVGAVYARRSYIPTALKWYLRDEYPLVEPLKGYSRFVFESIDFKLNFKRSLVETSKWRFSTRLGMGLNIVTASDFVGKDEVINNLNELLEFYEREQGFGGPPQNGRSNQRFDNTADSKRLVDPPNGWWEGGSALENSSLYVNGGFVMERLMNERWSVYVSPSFSRVVYLKKDEGIGPFKDRINPVGVRFGSRFHFGGK